MINEGSQRKFKDVVESVGKETAREYRELKRVRNYWSRYNQKK